MARRPINRPPAAARRRVSGDIKASSAWPRIEELIECGGTISIGQIHPIECAAVANDEHDMLAALVRRKTESFNDLMQRLDAAIATAIDHGDYTDEINTPTASRR